MTESYDIAIIGGGIMGLAHAYHAANAGLKTVVFERDAQGQGASVRNFGMLAIVAQAPGVQLDSARQSLKIWQELAAETGLSLTQAGCLFLARAPEEMAVLEECAAAQTKDDLALTLLAKSDLPDFCPHLHDDQMLGGIWSPDAWKVDQRQALQKITQWLCTERGVTFHFNTPVNKVETGQLETPTGTFKAKQIILCGGDDFATLFPNEFAKSGITRCRLQMQRTVPQPSSFQLKPFVLGGLSLPRYTSFAECPSLPELVAYQEKFYPRYIKHGIHVIAAQETDGSITVGDSHAYGVAPNGNAVQDIDDLIQAEVNAMIALPNPKIADRWLGHYAYCAGQDVMKLSLEKGVTAVTMTNGQGMTHGFAVAQKAITNLAL